MAVQFYQKINLLCEKVTAFYLEVPGFCFEMEYYFLRFFLIKFSQKFCTDSVWVYQTFSIIKLYVFFDQWYLPDYNTKPPTTDETYNKYGKKLDERM